MSEHHVPDLGAVTRPKPRIGAQIGALVRRLDEHGTFQAGSVETLPGGRLAVHPARGDVVDAETLVAMIAEAVRIEVAKMLVDAGVITAGS